MEMSKPLRSWTIGPFGRLPYQHQQSGFIRWNTSAGESLREQGH